MRQKLQFWLAMINGLGGWLCLYGVSAQWKLFEQWAWIGFLIGSTAMVIGSLLDYGRPYKGVICGLTGWLLMAMIVSHLVWPIITIRWLQLLIGLGVWLLLMISMIDFLMAAQVDRFSKDGD